MGNHNGKGSPDTTVSPLDFFHTAPTTPSEADLSAMTSASSSAKPQLTPSPAGSAAPSSTSPVADWSRKPCAPAELAMINIDGITCSGMDVSDAEARLSEAAGSAAPLPPSRGSPPELSWQDSGLEPQDAEEMGLVLLSLVVHYRDSLGLTPNTDVTTGAVELLRHLITQKDELVEEVDTLRETLGKERLEWQQFQCDLQVAVNVADRLRVEAEQALGLLQESHRAVEEQLAEELESLRVEHEDICRKLNESPLQQRQQQAEPDALRNVRRWKDVRDCDPETETQDSAEEKVQELQNETEAKNVEKENETNLEADAEVVNHDPEEANGSQGMQLTGKGVAEGYLCSLAALEKKKGRQRDPRRIVMLSERSWTLVLPTGPSDETSKNTLPLCKREEPQKQRRMHRILRRQNSWSGFYTGKQDEKQSSHCIKPQDCISAPPRRQGGSRRNALLRWSQSRTQGYKNIEITNFSRSWEDGLAFCAVYHTYVPTLIPYDTLNPADKVENLDLAFKTGECVGIRAALTVEEMLRADGPDWQKVLGYVESIFHHFDT